MKKYVLLYGKRLLRMLPFVLCVIAILFGSMAVIFASLRQEQEANTPTKYRLGLVGTGDDQLLNMGMAAFQSIDSIRFSLELVPLTEEEAQQSLTQRKITAYVIFPEGFMESAFAGKIIPLQYVSSMGSVGLVTMVKEEITQVIESLLLSSQKGSYGANQALQNAGLPEQGATHLNQLAIEYVDLVLDRGKVYTVQELGISDGLGLEGALLSGLCVVFLLLVCTPFAPMMIRSDRSMEQLLASRRIGCFRQIATEFSLYLLCLSVLVTGVLWALSPTGFLDAYDVDGSAIWKLLSVIFMTAAWSFLLFEISRDIISGVLLQFFSAVCMSFLSGCMFPAYFFPVSVQTISDYLPTGAARVQLSSCLTGTFAPGATWLLLIYGGIFVSLTLLLRYLRVRCDRR